MSDYSLLLVDDDQETLDSMARWFIRQGFEVASACHPRQALSAASRTKFDAVVLDAFLPESSGLELMDQLRRFCDAPVIMLTKRDNQELQHEAIERGVYRYLVKPVGARRLEEIINEALAAETPFQRRARNRTLTAKSLQ